MLLCKNILLLFQISNAFSNVFSNQKFSFIFFSTYRLFDKLVEEAEEKKKAFAEFEKVDLKFREVRVNLLYGTLRLSSASKFYMRR